ncbi:hypothetical protein PR202_ga23843 [Eleusine coracana subsp. coracana]|uniref:Glabrous enhancer-binding protein-like DBD domain-containing protein n=1 Tax=Eleusine coracana subsp. coracana TaxID=191504 RepID=A0AAV5D7L0_ELECO|nr:hypothetical protein PR202_ga23843 [Eleusine coracana subsp. coracana]
MAAADDPAAAVSSSAGDEDDEGTDTDGSNSDRVAVQGPDPDPDHQLLPDDAAPAPPPPPTAAPEPTGAVPPPPPQPSATDDSRRLFQRLWTDEEELLILRGFLDFTARRGTTFASHQYDTGPFYEEIRRRLSFEFTKSQLIEKLRRLKKKYRVCAARMAAQGAAFAFRSAHEGAIYDVARHIWRPAVRRDGNGAGGDGAGGDALRRGRHQPRGRGDQRRGGAWSGGGRRQRRERVREHAERQGRPARQEEDGAGDGGERIAHHQVSADAIANGATEETLRAILSPLLREVISSITVAGQTGLGLGLNMGFGGIGGVDLLGLGLGVASSSPVVSGDEKWRQQQILELEVYLKRIELVREQVTAALEELRSSEG